MSTQIKKAEATLAGLSTDISKKKRSVTNQSKKIRQFVEDPDSQTVNEFNKAKAKRLLTELESAKTQLDGVLDEALGLCDILLQAKSTEVTPDDVTTHEEAQSKYGDTFDEAHKLIFDLNHALNPPQAPAVAATTTSHERRWKPCEEFKPTPLTLEDSPIILESWISKLKSYLQGHLGQTQNNMFNLLDNLIEDSIKSAAGFNRTDEMAIFGDENSLEGKLRKRWEARGVVRLFLEEFDNLGVS